MTGETIRTKRRMYELLASGRLGNTIPQFFSLAEWEAATGCPNYGLWGIRSSLAGGDGRMRLNVPTAEVPDLYRQWFPAGGGNISPMIDKWARLRAEVWESHIAPCGLQMYLAAGYDPADPWRGSFRKYGRQAYGLEARALLKRHLWPSDLEDLRVLLDDFPGHVIEFSACSQAVGIVPNRNTVIWEVRNY